MDEVAFQDEVVAVLKKSLEGADVSIFQCLHAHLHMFAAGSQQILSS